MWLPLGATVSPTNFIFKPSDLKCQHQLILLLSLLEAKVVNLVLGVIVFYVHKGMKYLCCLFVLLLVVLW